MKVPEPTAGEVRWTFKVVGLCALILTLALAYGIVHKVNSSDAALQGVVRVASASADQVKRLNAQLDAQQRIDAQRAKQAARERAQQLHVSKVLVKILRKKGIPIPAGLFAPTSGTSSHRPKAHRPTSPGTPTPTAPRPTTSPTPTVCQLVPALCDGLPLGLPPLLPH